MGVEIFHFHIKSKSNPPLLFEGPPPSPQSPVPTVLIFLPVSSWNFPSQYQYLEHLFRNFRTAQVSFKHQELILLWMWKANLDLFQSWKTQKSTDGYKCHGVLYWSTFWVNGQSRNYEGKTKLSTFWSYCNRYVDPFFSPGIPLFETQPTYMPLYELITQFELSKDPDPVPLNHNMRFYAVSKAP